VTVRLFDPGPADERTLTGRQRQGLAAVRAAGWAGLTSNELGQILHQHPRGDSCGFCDSAANEVGSALRSKGLVERRGRRDGNRVLYYVWVDPDAKPAARDAGDFPEGY